MLEKSWVLPVGAAVLVVCSVSCVDPKTLPVLETGSSSLGGTWDYQVTNAFEAQFNSCTGDAAALEGMTYFEGFSAATICVASGQLQVIQEDPAVTVVDHEVSCSDGSSASVSAEATVLADVLTGEWLSVAENGVSTTQSFYALASGNGLDFVHESVSFDGSFSGSCDFEPPLTSRAIVN